MKNPTKTQFMAVAAITMLIALPAAAGNKKKGNAATPTSATSTESDSNTAKSSSQKKSEKKKQDAARSVTPNSKPKGTSASSLAPTPPATAADAAKQYDPTKQ